MVRWEAINDIGYLILDNGVFNLLDNAIFLELNDFKRWCEEKQIKGLVIAGKSRHFSAGANVEYIKKIKNDPPKLESNLNGGKDILNFIEESPFITVAAISGACFGAGFEIALRCNYRISTSSAVFAFPEVGLGIMPGFGGTVYLPKILGKKRALEMVLTGEMINSEEALKLGIVDKIVDKKELFNEGASIINRLCNGKSCKQIEYVLKTVCNSAGCSDEELCKLESKYFAQLAEFMPAE